MKIFKYEIVDGYIIAPLKRRTLRVDYVDDGFYKGYFLWAIVDPNEESFRQFLDSREFSDLEKVENQTFCGIDTNMFNDRVQLRVQEKQKVIMNRPVFAEDEDGKLYAYGYDYLNPKEYTICFYKTGQEIDLPVKNLRYLGLCKLWIMQELGLYVFAHE